MTPLKCPTKKESKLIKKKLVGVLQVREGKRHRQLIAGRCSSSEPKQKRGQKRFVQTMLRVFEEEAEEADKDKSM